MLQLIALVKNRDTRETMSGWNRPANKAMREAAVILREQGMNTIVKWDWIFCAPPLVVNEEQIGEGLAMLDQALTAADRHYEV